MRINKAKHRQNKVNTLRTTLLIAALLIIGGSVGWYFLQKKDNLSEVDKSQSINEPTQKKNPLEHGAVDTDFARKMIIHHQQAIQMNETAKKNASAQAVRQLAEQINIKESTTVKVYTDLLSSWNETYINLSDFPEMDGHDMYPTYPGMARVAELWVLESTIGSAFDKQLLQLMIKHHEGAIEMAKDTVSYNIQFGKMITLRDETVKRQTLELKKLKEILNEIK